MNRITAVVAGLSLAFTLTSNTTAQILLDFSPVSTMENSSTRGLAIADLDGDNDLDVVEGTQDDGCRIWLNDGTGGFVLGQTFFSGEEWFPVAIFSVALADFDGDGHPDAFIGGMAASGPWDPSYNTVWINDGNGFFTDSGQVLGDGYTRGVAVGDFDGDGDNDAVCANSNQPNRIWLNDGNGEFTASSQSLGASGDDTLDVAVGDVDNDGTLDIFFANDDSGTSFYLNDGSGTFIDSMQTTGSGLAKGVSLGDLNNDGLLDACIGYRYPSSCKVWMNDGNGTFSLGQQLAGLSTGDVALGDINGDGSLDVFTARWYNAPSANGNNVFINDGSGTFVLGKVGHGARTLELGSSQSSAVVLGDVNGDGDLDAVVGNYGQANRIWINKVRGACCTGDACIQLEIELCETIGAAFIGGDCDDSDCSDGPSCSGDTNNDGVIDIEDLLNMLSSFGSVCP